MSYEWLHTRKRRHAKLSEKTHPLKALRSVAHFLRNGAFILINDTLGIPITPRRLKVFEWLPEPILIAFLQRLFDTKTAELVITRHANAARDEMKELADELKALATTTSIPTPVMDRLFRYLDPAVPPVAEGSSQIPMHWCGMGIGLSVVAGMVFFFTWIRSRIDR